MKTHFLLLALLLLALNITAQTTGDTGNCTYTISADSTTLTISAKPGTDGKMAENIFATPPWITFLVKLNTLVINEGVTSIGSGAFMGGSFTGNLTIPESVTSIGVGAFYGCRNFTGNLTIPEGVISIGSSAFIGCSGFTGSLLIPDKVTSIGSSAFSGCSGFTGNLAIPEGITTIENYTFYGCRGLTGNLTIPEGVTSIGSYAFQHCSDFTGSLTIPESVTSIGEYAFSGCSGFIGNLVIPEGITSIENFVFSECSSLTGNLIIPSAVTSIGISAFSGCNGFTGNLAIPEGVTTIRNYAFSGCSGFTGDLVIPEGVTIIGLGAFSDCNGFTGNLIIPKGVTTIANSVFQNCSGFIGDLIIPESVTSIGVGAFFDCSGFTGDLVIPASVTSIEYGAFSGCSNLSSITCYASNPPALMNTSFENVPKTIPLRVPPASVNLYETAEYWEEFFNIIEIGSDATLSTLTVSEGTLTPAFNAEITEYTVEVENGVGSVEVTATANDPNAIVVGTGTYPLNVGVNNIEVKVTVQDGITEKTYKIDVTRKAGTGISIESDNSFAVYPNPTKGMVYIQTEYNYLPEIKLYDMSGKLLMQAKDNQIDITDFTNGTYILQFDKQKVSIIKQ